MAAGGAAGRAAQLRPGPVFAVWITRALLPGMGVEGVAASERLEEVLYMLKTKKKNWADRVRAEGVLDGARRLLVSQAGTRFGSSTTRKLALKLESVSDPQRLEVVGACLMRGMSAEGILARLGDHECRSATEHRADPNG